jgi:hypothetical protein
VAAWVLGLSQGVSRGTAIAQFLSSPEALHRVVAEDYATLLGRAPEALGGQGLLYLLLSGYPRLEEPAALALLSSDEFFSRATAA